MSKKNWWGKQESEDKTLVPNVEIPVAEETVSDLAEEVSNVGVVEEEVKEVTPIEEPVVQEPVKPVDPISYGDIFIVRSVSQAYILSGKSSWVKLGLKDIVKAGRYYILGVANSISVKGLMFSPVVFRAEDTTDIMDIRLFNVETTPKRIAEGEIVAHLIEIK